MKVITIVGTLGRDSEIRENKGGQFATFSVAVNKGYSRDAGTDWFQVNYYNTKLSEYLTKGKKVVVSGSLDIVDKDTDNGPRTYYNIRANQVEFADSGKRSNDAPSQPSGADSPPPPPNDMDNEIPF